MAVLVWKQFSDVCPLQTAGLTSTNRFPHFKSRHLRCQYLSVRLLQRDPRNIQYLQGWWIFDHLDLDLPGKSHTKTVLHLKELLLKEYFVCFLVILHISNQILCCAALIISQIPIRLVWNGLKWWLCWAAKSHVWMLLLTLANPNYWSTLKESVEVLQ